MKNYILDTNVLLHDPNSLLNFEDNNVLLPIEVIEEIDRFKRESSELGQNARAALIARGFAEMTRFGLSRGARRETLSGLSGLGDLVLTCSSTSSRNYSLGKGIGEGRPAADLLADRQTVAEGAFTAPVLAQIARREGIDMPIVEAVADLIAGRCSVDAVLEALLSRPPKPEAV